MLPSTLRVARCSPNFAPRLLKGCCKGLESHRRKLEAEGQDQGEMGVILRMMISIRSLDAARSLGTPRCTQGFRRLSVSERVSSCKGRFAVRVATMKPPIFVTANAVEDR